MTQITDNQPQPSWQAPQVEPPAPRPWFKKKWVWAAAVVGVIIIASAAGSSSSKTKTQSGTLAATGSSSPATTAPAAPATTAPAPTTTTAPAPTTTTTEKVDTCANVREALLTGTQAQIDTAMAALQADKSADDTAREYADYYLHRDAGQKDLRDMDVSLIREACSLS